MKKEKSVRKILFLYEQKCEKQFQEKIHKLTSVNEKSKLFKTSIFRLKC